MDITSYKVMVNYAVNDAHLLTMGAEHHDEKRNASMFTKKNEMTRQSVDYQTVYLQDEWEISDTLNIVLGGRYNLYSISVITILSVITDNPVAVAFPLLLIK